MATPPDTTRAERYALLLPQLQALVAGETDAVAMMANLCAAIRETFGWHWVGFYRVMGDELVLGPFQGPSACSRIARTRGVCGHAWSTGRSIVVADVHDFPGHIACSPLSRSELVVPIRGRAGAVAAVLDLDSVQLAEFTEDDARAMEQAMKLLSPLLA